MASNLYLESYNKILYILHQFFSPKYLLRMYFWKGTQIPFSWFLWLTSSASAFGWERSKEVLLNLAKICHLWSMLYSIEAVYKLKSFTRLVKELVCVLLWYIFGNKMFSISCLMGNVSSHAHSRCLLYCMWSYLYLTKLCLQINLIYLCVCVFELPICLLGLCCSVHGTIILCPMYCSNLPEIESPGLANKNIVKL